MIVTGSYNKIRGSYRMHSPVFPYDSITYVGYTLAQTKRAYRQQYGLKYKHIEWIII